MGIQGLIPFLEKASKPTNVSEFSGGTAVIDAYCWLHKGVFSCADKLARGEDCLMYVTYCMKFVNMLLAKNIKPILVFDGQKLPAKMETEAKRRESREQNRKKAAELMRQDRNKDAQTYLRRCIDISPEMALNLIRACRSRNVDCIVAPYEADAQLAFLNMQNLADVIITEDSDLLLFGAKKVLFKMDVNGNGLLIERSKLHVAMGVKEQDFSFDKFRYMCILSGCDYLSSLSGIGLVKASKFIKRTADPDIYRALSRLSLHLNMPQLCVTQEYRDKFMDADFMFKYQPVYDPRERRLRPLTDLDPEDENYAKYRKLIEENNLSEEQLKNLAYGNLDPLKHTKLDDWSPSKKTEASNNTNRKNGWSDSSVSPYPSIWSENYDPNSWTKPKTQPPNALCPSSTKTNTQRENPSAINRAGDRRSLPATKRIVLPKARLSLDQDYCDESNPVEDVDPLPVNEEISSTDTQPKKSHHNPFSKSSQLTTSERKNVSMLDKLQRLCHSTENDSEIEAHSGYFSNNTLLTATAALNSQQSPPSSPIISGRSSKAKLTLFMKDYGRRTRSPLKALNTSSGCEDDFGTISQNYSSFCGNENESESGEEEKVKTEPVRTMKRAIPFTVTSAEKKTCSATFLEKLNAFRRESKTSSSFSWTRTDESMGGTAMNICTSMAVESDFKKPSEDCSVTQNSDKVLSQPSDEDEGFCSPDSWRSDLSSEDTVNNIDNSGSCSLSARKLSWTSCRTSGLKKRGPKQLSLDQFAFKSATKMKR